MAVGEKRKIHCNGCGQDTWHELKAQQSREDTVLTYKVEPSGERGEVSGEFEYVNGAEIWACCGCEAYVFRSWDEYPWGEPDEAFYPPRAKDHIKAKRFRKLPAKLKRIYGEIIEAFNRESLILCAGGLRALLEGICNDKGIAGRTLEVQIDGLKRFVPDGIVGNLHGIRRFLGNVALHKLQVPQKKDLVLAIEVIEDVMNVIYELDYKSGRLMQALKPPAATTKGTPKARPAAAPASSAPRPPEG